MSNSKDIKKEINQYIRIFFALGVLTVITVAIAYIDVGKMWIAVLLAMIVASIKGTLVAGFFMHLFHEKKIIYLFLGITLVLLCSLFFITFGSIYNQVLLQYNQNQLINSIHLVPKPQYKLLTLHYLITEI